MGRVTSTLPEILAATRKAPSRNVDQKKPKEEVINGILEMVLKRKFVQTLKRAFGSDAAQLNFWTFLYS